MFKDIGPDGRGWVIKQPWIDMTSFIDLSDCRLWSQRYMATYSRNGLWWVEIAWRLWRVAVLFFTHSAEEYRAIATPSHTHRSVSFSMTGQKEHQLLRDDFQRAETLFGSSTYRGTSKLLCRHALQMGTFLLRGMSFKTPEVNEIHKRRELRKLPRPGGPSLRLFSQ